MRKILLALFALLPLLGAQEKPSAPAEAPILDVSVEHGLPGSLPGTERWIVLFKQRSFDLSDFRSAVYSGASAAEVARIVKDLEDEVKADQADFARFIEKLGGKVVVQWWIINGCAVDIPFDKLDQVRRNPRVAFVEPDRIRKPLAPILTSTNTRNHVVDPLQAQGYMAKGVSVAIMDTGQDSNMGGTGRPHATYYVNGDINNKTGGGIGGSRLLANIKVGAANPDDVHGHGTGVAGIAAGEKWNKASFSDRGHAPMAGIVGYSIANSSNGSSTSTVMTTAWQKIAADKVKYGIVAANNSYTGSPNPLESTQRALDSAALNADILPVVAAGNRSSSTRSSQSVVNGLAVGAVNPTIKKMASFSSRGPLYGDSRRFYPDLCACGVGTVMPRRNNEGSYYRASGTSMASPQVCGAATLFRSVAKKATALETKAALLASTEDISKQNPSPPYNTRNAYGLGFLRDDRALEIAKGNGLLMTSTLTKAAPKKIIPMAVKAGKAYSVVIAWHRQSTSTTQWSNLALTIRFLGRVIGSSDTPRNLYEKVVFVAPSIRRGGPRGSGPLHPGNGHVLRQRLQGHGDPAGHRPRGADGLRQQVGREPDRLAAGLLQPQDPAHLLPQGSSLQLHGDGHGLPPRQPVCPLGVPLLDRTFHFHGIHHQDAFDHQLLFLRQHHRAHGPGPLQEEDQPPLLDLREYLPQQLGHQDPLHEALHLYRPGRETAPGGLP